MKTQKNTQNFFLQNNPPTLLNSFKMKKHSDIGITFGSIFLCESLAFLIILFALAKESNARENILIVTFTLVTLAIGIKLIKNGREIRKFIKNFGEIIANRSYITIEELSEKTSLPPENIVRQIKQMKYFKLLVHSAPVREETTPDRGGR